MIICFWVSYAGAYEYTYYLWPDASIIYVVPSAFLMCMIGFLYLIILMLGCVLVKQTFRSFRFNVGIIALFSVLCAVKSISAINSVVLTSRNVDLISDEISMTEFLIPFIISVGRMVIISNPHQNRFLNAGKPIRKRWTRPIGHASSVFSQVVF